MMQIEVSAKKIEDAIAQGLKELNATIDQVNVQIVDSGGLFRKAKVILTLENEEQPEKPEVKQTAKPEKPAKPDNTETNKAEPVKKPAPVEKKSEQAKADKKPEQPKKQPPVKQEKPAKPEKPVKQEKPEPDETTVARRAEEDRAACVQSLEFVNGMVERMGFKVSAEVENGMIEITAPDGDDSLIIGRHGETLSAISYLAETVIRAEKKHATVTVDCNGYRSRRAASLAAMARRRADECVSKRRKIKLEPMERIDRRTVHNALTGDNRVTTVSEGKEPYRYIVIAPKKG